MHCMSLACDTFSIKLLFKKSLLRNSNPYFFDDDKAQKRRTRNKILHECGIGEKANTEIYCMFLRVIQIWHCVTTFDDMYPDVPSCELDRSNFSSMERKLVAWNVS